MPSDLWGGFSGDPQHAIRNEHHVLFAEIAFAQGLLADLAPAHDDALPHFEETLVAACREAGALGLLFQYVDDVRDDRLRLTYNQILPLLYHSKANPDHRIEEFNRWLKYANDHEDWCPWVRWSLLGTPETQHLTDAFRRLLSQHARQDHTMTREERDAYLTQPIIRESLAKWDAYRKRPRALEVLHEARVRAQNEHRLDDDTVARLKAVRMLDLLPGSQR